MLSIDEVIAKEKANAEKLRKDNENCKYKSEYGCKGCADYYSKPCIECAKEHEQLAEWLEELKELRELLDERLYEKLIYSKVAEDNYNKGYADGSLSVTSEIRNKVIDECLGVLYRNGGKIISIRFYEEIFKEMEQLKEGGVNETNN